MTPRPRKRPSPAGASATRLSPMYIPGMDSSMRAPGPAADAGSTLTVKSRSAMARTGRGAISRDSRPSGPAGRAQGPAEMAQSGRAALRCSSS